MKRFAFFSLLFVAVFFASEARAQTIYTEDFETLSTGNLASTTAMEYGTLTTSFAGDIATNPQTWSAVVSDRSKDTRAIETYRTTVSYDFYSDVYLSASTTDEVYMSVWLWIPAPDTYLEVDDGILSMSDLYTYNSAGTGNAVYWQLCVEENETFSLKQSDGNAGVAGSCGNTSYSPKAYGGNMGAWNRIDWRVSDTTGYLCSRINNGEWGACENVGSSDKGFRRWNIWSSAIYGTAVRYDDTFDHVTVDDLVLTTADIFGYDTIGENSWLIMRTPCYADSQTSPTGECGLDPASVGMDLDLTGYIDITDTPAKIDIVTYYFANDFKWVLEPLANASYTYTTSGTKYIIENFVLTVPFSTTTNPIYKTVACIIPPEDSVYFGGEAGQCVTVKWCNGSSDIECGGIMRSFGIGGYGTTTNPDGTTVWEDLDCDNIGITDVKKGAQCALVWAFAPNDTVTIKWAQVKSHMLSIWPIGYGTLILSDFKDAVTSTSTEYFDNDINVGRWFGRPDAENATITISVAHSVSEMGKFEVFVDYAEKIMWILFAIWVFGFAVTRKL